MRNLFVLAVAVTAAAAHASVGDGLTGHLTVDNSFSLYVSTTDASLGTLVGSGSDWTNASAMTPTALAPGQDYYLHLVGHNEGTLGSGYDSGNPAAFLGDFSLSGSGHRFANGTSSLLTDGANWKVNLTGFGTPMAGATELAQNGGGIWGSVHGGAISGVASSAKWIWAASTENGQTAYFSSKVQAVPEPTSIAAMAVGALGLLRRRRKA